MRRYRILVTAGWVAGMSCDDGRADVVGTERRDIFNCVITRCRDSSVWYGVVERHRRMAVDLLNR